MRITHLLLASAVLLAFTAGTRAQDVLETTSGAIWEGKITSNDGKSVVITTNAGATMTLEYDLLTPQTQYRMRRNITPKDAQAQLDLANWCVANKLYYEAKIQFRAALKTDPAMEDKIQENIAVAKITASKELLERGKSLATSNPQESRRILSLLVQELPEEEASKEAAQILATETAQRQQNAMTRAAASSSGSGGKGEAPAVQATRADGQPFSEATRTLFKPVIESYHKMLDATQAGLTKTGSQSIDQFEKAIKEGNKIRSQVDGLKSEGANNEEVTEAIALAESKLEEAVVDARIDLVDCYMLRSSYVQAAEVVKQGMAQYPKNERLRGAMNQVTAATADDGGGGWVMGGRFR